MNTPYQHIVSAGEGEEEHAEMVEDDDPFLHQVRSCYALIALFVVDSM